MVTFLAFVIFGGVPPYLILTKNSISGIGRNLMAFFSGFILCVALTVFLMWVFFEIGDSSAATQLIGKGFWFGIITPFIGIYAAHRRANAREKNENRDAQ